MESKRGEKKVGRTTPPPPSMRQHQTQTPSPPSPTTQTSAVIPLIIALILILVTVLYFWRRKGRRGRSVLILGPCDAGKTALFSQIVKGGREGDKEMQTVTSLIPNVLEYEPRNGRPGLMLKDLPGHDRVQTKFWNEHKGGARGILCVVDAAAGSRGIREAADVLYRVLTDPAVISACPGFLIFANKQDLPMSKGSNVIRNQLEREITTLRMTKSAGLTSTGGKDSGRRILGRSDKDFEFNQLTDLKIEFCEGSAIGGSDSFIQTTIMEWLDSVA